MHCHTCRDSQKQLLSTVHGESAAAGSPRCLTAAEFPLWLESLATSNRIRRAGCRMTWLVARDCSHSRGSAAVRQCLTFSTCNFTATAGDTFKLSEHANLYHTSPHVLMCGSLQACWKPLHCQQGRLCTDAAMKVQHHQTATCRCTRPKLGLKLIQACSL